ncbi:MAG: o-succinylbenzoate synthase [Acidobacteria bacterium]|nr:o-succinylbenzoate synthase [Acidobacteriota bacterium]
MRVEEIELREIRLPLVRFFETSFGRTTQRRIVLVRVSMDGLTGYGECTAGEGPFYSYETADTAWHVLKDFVGPNALRNDFQGAIHVRDWLRPIRGHPMAKAALEAALWDWEARSKNKPLWKLLDGKGGEIPCGVSIGIQDTVEELLAGIEREIGAGYRRIKVKIKPGWDWEILKTVRRHFPHVPLMADANSAYSLADLELLRRLDEFQLMMIEQPLAYHDLFDHAVLQEALRTPICLDESIRQVEDARHAIELGSCRIINMKLGRVGGFTEALQIHSLCLASGIPLWCGGMLESGIGRAHNIALSTLEGFTLPGDVSASKRYWERDIVQPPVEVTPHGTIRVPDGPGIGYQPDLEFIDRITVRKEVLRA